MSEPVGPLAVAISRYFEKSSYAEIGETESTKAGFNRITQDATRKKICRVNGDKIVELSHTIERAQVALKQIKATNADDYRHKAAPHNKAIAESASKRSELRRLNRAAIERSSAASGEVLRSKNFLRLAKLEAQEAWYEVERIAAKIANVNRTPSTIFSLAENDTAARIEYGDSKSPSSKYYGCCIVHQDGRTEHLKRPARLR